MSKIDVGQTVTILANIGVIAGIIFLAIELAQNNQLLRMQAQMQLAQNQQGVNEAISGDESLARILVKVELGESLDEVEQLRLERFYRISFAKWESEYRLLQEGLLTEDEFRIENLVNVLHSNPGMFDIWLQRKESMHPGLVEWIEANGDNK